jgi:hypothetical protein
MASPACTVNATATTNGVDATAGATTTIALISSAGVKTWSISCTGTDELLVAGTINAGLTIDGVAKTGTFTQPVAGSALIFTSSVTDNNGLVSTTTFGVYTRTAAALRVGAVGETTEGNAAFGTTSTVNAKIRQAAGGGSALPKTRTRRSAASASTVTTADDLIEVIAPANPITLPASPSDGHEYEVKNNTSGNNNVLGNGHNFDVTGTATFVLAPQQSTTFTYSSGSAMWLTT